MGTDNPPTSHMSSRVHPASGSGTARDKWMGDPNDNMNEKSGLLDESILDRCINMPDLDVPADRLK